MENVDWKWRGWYTFRNAMIRIWDKCILEGDMVLENCLTEDDGILKEIFFKVEGKTDTERYENFLSMIHKFWEQNYHFVASNYTELVAIFDHYRNSVEWAVNVLCIMPEDESNNTEGRNGNYAPFAITKDLYESIRKNMREDGKLYITSKKDKRVFKLEIGKTSYNSHGKEPKQLNMSEIIIIDID